MPRFIFIVEPIFVGKICFVVSRYKLDSTEHAYLYDEMADDMIFANEKHAALKWSIIGEDLYEPPFGPKRSAPANIIAADVIAGKLKKVEIA